MRRGLMAWNPEELPLETLKARVARLQAALASQGLAAILLYTNFIRSGAVSHLTAFSPYWADGILMVPRAGEPVFATTLSNRVASWIESVKPIGTLMCTPTPGAALAEKLKGQGDKVAILELDAFPGGVYDELARNLPGVAIVDGGAVFAAARAELDAVERALLAHADAIARASLTGVDLNLRDAGAIVGAAEAAARLAGAEEAYVAIAPDLDADHRFRRVASTGALGKRFALRMTVAYKGNWVRRTRTFPAHDGADTWFDGLVGVIDPARPIGVQLARAVETLPAAELRDWLAEAVVGTRPLSALASPALDNGALKVPALVLSVRLNIDGRPWCATGVVTGAEASG